MSSFMMDERHSILRQPNDARNARKHARAFSRLRKKLFLKKERRASRSIEEQSQHDLRSNGSGGRASWKTRPFVPLSGPRGKEERSLSLDTPPAFREALQFPLSLLHSTSHNNTHEKERLSRTPRLLLVMQ
ncbi:hypothetical protein CEXT_370321 [Caerostris extrusa]|uniref:Uncharacterized protein n=1 Tax=Caerostris extrusa TaxID=172846 RepID=A0AAV4NEF5_CAEEX|nr:hypothetical protein CEXT_370321 [Caerostris extrusa]